MRESQKKIKVVHCVRNAYPFLGGGGSIRTKHVIDALARYFDINVLVSNFNRSDKQIILGKRYEVSNTKYYVFNSNSIKNIKIIFPRLFGVLESWMVLYRYYIFILNNCKIIEPSIIHAHSSFKIGLPALLAARKLNIPLIYELRSLEEYSRIANRACSNNLDLVWLRFWENFIVRHSDSVVCINEGIRKVILQRKLVEKQKTVVVPNGVNNEVFSPKQKDKLWLSRFGLKDKFVIAMVSPRYHEGIMFLLDAIVPFFERVKNARLVLIGEGKNRSEKLMINKTIVKNNLSKHIISIGRVPFEEMNRYYNSVDLLVLPRINSKENNIVTPLKPLEMMAAGRVILASDVEGFAPLIKHADTGFLFKTEDKEDFLKQLLYIFDHKNELEAIGIKARKWVNENYSWNMVVRGYIDIYQKVLNKSLFFYG